MCNQDSPDWPNPDGLARLNQEIEDLLAQDESYAYSFIPLVERNLKQYNLDRWTEPHEVIHEAYERARKFIQRGNEIINIKAWLKKTILNIVREKERQRRRQPAIDPQSSLIENYTATIAETISDAIETDSDSLSTIGQKLKAWKEALTLFEKEEREVTQLLIWKLHERLSWKEIQERLQQRGEDVPSLTALRQQASRGKRKLHRLYHQIEEERLGVQQK